MARGGEHATGERTKLTRNSTAIVWFRRDLRVGDHSALSEAVTRFAHVACLYVLDDGLLSGRYRSPHRLAFLQHSLLALSASLQDRGGALVVRRGRPEDVVPAFARELKAGAVLVSRDYTPYARRRDGQVAVGLGLLDVEFVATPGLLVAEPEDITNQQGLGFKVFGAFLRRWKDLPLRPVVPAPDSISAPVDLRQLVASDLDCLGPSTTAYPLVEGSERAAMHRLGQWVEGPLARYATNRDRLDVVGTSGLSQDLHFGLLSPATVLHQTAGANRFVEEVAWRDFYLHLAWHSPAVLRGPYRRALADLPWVNDPDALSAWKSGETGYPVVDAAMRQLVETGWMHNRARMIVASFLAKHILVDYREGERFFMQNLVDGDVAVNNGGWQWASSTGADAPPYFRVFNPILQGQRFDPEGLFVRHWVPELRDMPTRFVHAPWAAPLEIQAAVGCVLGRDYPPPIVPHAFATARARAIFVSVLRRSR